MDLRDPFLRQRQTKVSYSRARLGDVPYAVDQQHRLAVQPEIPPVTKQRRNLASEASRPARFVGLRHENVAVEAIPIPGPRLIGPAYEEGEVRFATRQDFEEWPLEQSLAREPVVPIAESLDPGMARQFRLYGPRIRQSQIIEPQIPWNPRLVVPAEEWSRSRDIRPFGEPGSPPLVVLRDRMELRKIESYEPDAPSSGTQRGRAMHAS